MGRYNIIKRLKLKPLLAIDVSKFNIRLSSEHLALEESGFPDGVNCPIRVRRFLFFISNNVLHASIRGTIFLKVA